jgi:hypothetical protein
MPPQQPDRLLDLLDEGLDFSAHVLDLCLASVPPAPIVCDAIARFDLPRFDCRFELAIRTSRPVVAGSPGQAGR